MQVTTASDVTTMTTGASTAIAASYNLSEVGVMVGIVFTVLSFCTSLFFHIRRERRAINEAMHDHRVWKAGKDREVRESSKREDSTRP